MGIQLWPLWWLSSCSMCDVTKGTLISRIHPPRARATRDWSGSVAPSPGRVAVFRAECDTLGCVALIWASDLHGIVNTDQGMIVRYRCVCGEPAEMLTGPAVRVSVHSGRVVA
jgi:hypothetical protein